MTSGAGSAELASSVSLARPRRPERPVRPSDEQLGELARKLQRCGEEAGLAAIGIAPATPMATTRRILEERKAAGLSGGMQFTYRNPERSTDPGRVLAGAAALVVGAWAYGETPSERRTVGAGAASGAYTNGGDDRPQGQVARYARHDHYQDLRAALGQVVVLLKGAGWGARVVADDNALVDRAAAQRAGLGWFGKNTNILLSGRGSWFLLGSVVTDAPLRPSAPVGDGCGSCQRCLGSCPTGALVAPGVLDARKCLAWLLQATGVFPFEYRVPLEGRIYGCDDCQEVCPANRVAARLAPGSDGRTENAVVEDANVDLLGLLSASDESLLDRYGRWYIPQRDPRYLRRNSLIALGNVAEGSQPEVAATLVRYLDGPDDLLRAHAIWAAVRAGRQDLVAARPALVDDPSSTVRDELAHQSQVPVRSASPR